MHIAIDARIISSSTGRYIERLVYYLQEVDAVNQYSILVRSKDINFFKPSAPNFTVKVADFADYSFAEQIGFKKFLDKLAPDLVHFCMPQQPILYKGKHVTTVHDLNLLKTYNSDKNWLVFHLKQLVGRYVFKKISKTSSHIIVPSQFTKDEYIAFSGIPEEKVTLAYEAADISTTSPQPYKQPFKDFIMYVGQQSDYKNIKRLGDAHQKLLAKHPDLGLILVGRKNAPVLKNEAYFNEQGYKNILFTDFIEDPQRDWLFTKCKAYVRLVIHTLQTLMRPIAASYTALPMNTKIFRPFPRVKVVIAVLLSLKKVLNRLAHLNKLDRFVWPFCATNISLSVRSLF